MNVEQLPSNNALTYYEANKDKILQKYYDNKEKKLSYQNEYNKQNKDKYKEYQKNYYQRRKEGLLNAKKEKIECECGKMISSGHLSTHKKSNLHTKWLERKQQSQQPNYDREI
jgi:hypothetical protein